METKLSHVKSRHQALVSSFLRNWLVPVLYVAVLIAVYIRFGFLFQFTLGLVWLCVIPVVAYFGRSREFIRNTAFVVSALLSYEALQGVTGSIVDPKNVVSLAAADKAIFGFNFTAAVQNAFASAAVTFVSTIFYGMHLFLVAAALIIFWFTSKKVFNGYAYSIILTSYLALITFILVPTAPPWFVGTAKNLIPDAGSLLPSGLQSVQQILMAIESDKFAAFPSLHGAYVTLLTVYSFRVSKKWGILALAIAGGVLFSTIYLGQHFVMDLAGGVVYSLAAIFVVDKMLARFPQLN